MASLVESLGADLLPIHDALVAGVDVLSGQQTVDFVPYVRVVLPLDGFVFWLRASLLTAAQLAQNGLESADAVTVPGSLHYASVGHMVEDEVIAVRRVDFTAEEPVGAFAEIAPTVIYVGVWTTTFGSFRFTFSSRSSFYYQASMYHYVGDAVFPVFEQMLIDDVGGFDQRQVVSNSMPLWLEMIASPPFATLVTPQAGQYGAALQLYPAFFVPQNLEPPYGAVDIPPSSTRALQSRATLGPTMSRSQLVTERARIILYGLRNDEVMDFLDFTIQYSADVGTFGVMNSPVVQDDRRSQVELATLAQKKMIDFEINYYQERARDVARQLVTSAKIGAIYGSDHPIVPEPPPFIIGPLT